MIDNKENNKTHSIASILVPCSARKAKLPLAHLRVTTLHKGWQSQVARDWLDKLGIAVPEQELLPAQDLYVGRAFQSVIKITGEVRGQLFVISSGLGLIPAATALPSYDLTLSPHAQTPLQMKLREPLNAPKWWEGIQTNPYACAIESIGKGEGRILVALTQPYANLVGPALAGLPEVMRNRLRIFGHGLGPRIPQVLHQYIMPYDRRLDVLSPGTRLDAASRALIHFARLTLQQPITTVEADRSSIEASLAEVSLPDVQSRQRVTDLELKEHLATFANAGLSASVALRRLRDESCLACEERRFRRLYEEVLA